MNVIVSIFRFLYRIRYWLLLGPLSVAALAFYFTQNLPTSYEANTTIYTGIASGQNIDNESSNNKNPNNAFDNIIYLVHSRSILERLSIRLLAQAMMKGDPNNDNQYISAANYKNLLQIVPSDVKKLIDKSSEEKTVQNLFKYKKEEKTNFIYGLLNWSHPHYSVAALSNIDAHRLGSSDMIELKYNTDDPGIVYQTLNLLNEELLSTYTKIQLGPSSNVLEYFEKQQDLARENLKSQEDSLQNFNQKGNIFNYDLETSLLSERISSIETQYEQALLDFNSSQKLIANLENRLSQRTDLMKKNQQFIQTLNSISSLTKRITDAEIFKGDNASDENDNSTNDKDALQKSEQQLYSIANDINRTNYSKEGIAMNTIVENWLSEVLKNEKAKAEMSILIKREKEVDAEYKMYSAMGPSLKRQQQEITFSENSYSAAMSQLANAKLQQKNDQMLSTKLNIVTPPVYPLTHAVTKRKSIILIAFFGCFLFILGCFLILELLDKTIRDKYRASVLCKAPVIGALPGNQLLKFRRYASENSRSATAYTCNQLMYYFKPGSPTIFNLISKDPLEGKSHVAINMKSYWEEMGLKVKIASYHKDFQPENRQYFQASNIGDLIEIKANDSDIILVEYPPLTKRAIPGKLLQNASANLYVVKANRAWKESDKIFLSQIQEHSNGTPVFILLNKAEQFAVEDFTGQLPPYSKLRNFTFKLLQLELSAEKDTTIED